MTTAATVDFDPLSLALTEPVPIPDRERVARVYLAAELGRLLPGCDHIPAALAGLEGKPLWRLLEAMSFTYRANGMFSLISSPALDWHEATFPVSEIILTGLNPELNKITRACGRSPSRFGEYITDHPDDEALAGLRPDARPPSGHPVMLRWHEGKLEILDGTHRLMVVVLRGGDRIRAVCGVPSGEKARPRYGDAVFIRMKHQYLLARSARDRRAVLRVTRMLAARASDSRDAIQIYWIDHEDGEGTERVHRAARHMLRWEPRLRGVRSVLQACRWW